MPVLQHTGILAAACIGLFFLQNRALFGEIQAPGQRTILAESDASGTYRHAQRLQAGPAAPEPPVAGNHPLAPLDRSVVFQPEPLHATPAEAAAADWIDDLARRYGSEHSRQRLDELARTAERQAYQLQQREAQLDSLWTLIAAGVPMLAVAAALLLRLRHARAKLGRSLAQSQRSQREVQALNTGLEQRLRMRGEELTRQTGYLQTLIDSLPFRIWLQDRDGCYVAVNQAYADSCGRDPLEMVGKSVDEVRPDDLPAALHGEELAVPAAGEPGTIEHSVTGPAGVRWLETCRVAVRSGDGTLLGVVGVCCDISDRKAAAAAREQALNEAVRLARMRSEFLGHMSHELRTPLNAILGHAQLLQRDPAAGERQRDRLEVIRQNGQHLLAVINDMLELSRTEAGKLELTPGLVVLRPLLEAIAGTIGVRSREKGLEFTSELAADLPETAWLDERRLRQVLLNLLDNAVKFTARGRVTLRVMPAGPERLRFEVQDTGSGIAADLLEKIFQPFEQVGDLRQRVGGTGLGLAISRQHVRMMGGDIAVESRLGQGSTFYFEIDAEAARPALEALPRQPPQPILPQPPKAEEPASPPAVEVQLPAPQRERFLELARLGNMRELRAWADQLEALEPETYRAAADQVRRLADDYESGQLLELAQRWAAAPAAA
jgi:PAS domain S-box-containing protein